MVTAQQFERIQQLVQPITAISIWLLPKVVKLTVLGLLSIAWLTFYFLQFWAWHYLLLIPLFLLAIPIGVLAVWALLLWDLTELPEALEVLRDSVLGLKERISADSEKAAKTTVSLGKTRQLPTLLKELLGLAQGVGSLGAIVTHVVFLANPISWLLFLISGFAALTYGFWALVTVMFYSF